MKKKALLASIVTIALCLCLIVGSTYALLTSKAEVNIAVTSGDVNAVATIDSGLKTWSLGQTEANATNGSFVNGGTADLVGGKLIISKMTPGDTVKFTINVKNTSDVVTKYKLSAASTVPVAQAGEDEIKDLIGALSITAHVKAVNRSSTVEQEYAMAYSGANSDKKEFSTGWFTAPATDGENAATIMTIVVTVTFPNRAPELDNPYKKAQASIAFTVDAVQGNGVDSQGNLITP